MFSDRRLLRGLRRRVRVELEKRPDDAATFKRRRARWWDRKYAGIHGPWFAVLMLGAIASYSQPQGVVQKDAQRCLLFHALSWTGVVMLGMSTRLALWSVDATVLGLLAMPVSDRRLFQRFRLNHLYLSLWAVLFAFVAYMAAPGFAPNPLIAAAFATACGIVFFSLFRILIGSGFFYVGLVYFGAIFLWEQFHFNAEPLLWMAPIGWVDLAYLKTLQADPTAWFSLAPAAVLIGVGLTRPRLHVALLEACTVGRNRSSLFAIGGERHVAAAQAALRRPPDEDGTETTTAVDAAKIEDVALPWTEAERWRKQFPFPVLRMILTQRERLAFDFCVGGGGVPRMRDVFALAVLVTVLGLIADPLFGIYLAGAAALGWFAQSARLVTATYYWPISFRGASTLMLKLAIFLAVVWAPLFAVAGLVQAGAGRAGAIGFGRAFPAFVGFAPGVLVLTPCFFLERRAGAWAMGIREISLWGLLLVVFFACLIATGLMIAGPWRYLPGEVFSLIASLIWLRYDWSHRRGSLDAPTTSV